MLYLRVGKDFARYNRPMSHVFLATLGQRPEAITVALDVLRPDYHFSHIVILHTEPYTSGIPEALGGLKRVLREDYEGIEVIL